MTEWIAYPYTAPESDGEYLVTVNIIGCRVVGISYFRGGKFTESDNRVLAWMPLPEPYYRNKKTRTNSARYEEDDPARYPTEGIEEPVEYDRGIPVYCQRLDDLDKLERQFYEEGRYMTHWVSNNALG